MCYNNIILFIPNFFTKGAVLSMETKEDINKLRDFLKSHNLMELSDIETDQEKELPQPPLQKQCPSLPKLIDLIPPELFTCGSEMSVLDALRHRKSRRVFSDDALTLEELSFLLWSMQGVKKILNKGYITLRTAPSAGARHPFETYAAVFNVKGLEEGIYRYLPLDHKLLFTGSSANLKKELAEAALGQKFAADCAVAFILTAVPYRTEWRYDIGAHKLIALDAGHAFENLYMAAESINAGTCAIGAYDQEKMDKLLNVDGEDEFAVYLAPVGRQKK